MSNINTSSLSIHLKIFLFFLFFFSVLFFQFLQAGSLPGLIDSWWYLTVFNEYWNQVECAWSGVWLGNALYPESGVSIFAEPAYGSALFFWILKLIGLNDVLTYNILMILVFSTNAFGVYLIAHQYLQKQRTSIFAGLVFAASAFSYGHLDDIKVVTFFPALLSIFYFKKFLEAGERKYFIYTIIIGGIGIYFSSYVFILGTVILGCLTLYYSKRILANPFLWKNILIFSPLYLILIIPFARIYLWGDVPDKTYNPIAIIEMAKAVSLNFLDLLQPMRHNLIYPSGFEAQPNWAFSWHAAFSGILVYSLALLGVWKSPKYRIELSLLFAAGFIIALGPSTQIGGQTIPMPMYLVYQYTDYGSLFRIPIRAYFICLLCLAIWAGSGLQFVLEKVKYTRWILGLAILIFMVENIPFPFQKYESSKYLDPPTAYQDFLEKQEKKVVLNLPSRTFDTKYYDHFSASAREHIYMYWQTKHRNHVLNGSGLTKSRMANQALIEEIGSPEKLKILIEKNGLNYLVFHKALLLPHEDFSDLEVLNQSLLLKKVIDTEELSVFEVK